MERLLTEAGRKAMRPLVDAYLIKKHVVRVIVEDLDLGPLPDLSKRANKARKIEWVDAARKEAENMINLGDEIAMLLAPELEEDNGQE